MNNSPILYIWKITRITKDFHGPYDCLYSIVASAYTEYGARVIAQQNAGDEIRIPQNFNIMDTFFWINAANARCNLIGLADARIPQGLICKEYN